MLKLIPPTSLLPLYTNYLFEASPEMHLRHQDATVQLLLLSCCKLKGFVGCSVSKLCYYACGGHALCHVKECFMCKQYVVCSLRLHCCWIAVVHFNCSFWKSETLWRRWYLMEFGGRFFVLLILWVLFFCLFLGGGGRQTVVWYISYSVSKIFQTLKKLLHTT